jgi:pilus assembly protein CpaE
MVHPWDSFTGKPWFCSVAIEALMRTLVVSHDVMDAQSSRLRGLLRTMVDNQGPAAATFTNVEQLAAQTQPELVVVSLAPDPERSLEALRQVRRAVGCFIITVGAVTDPRLILRAQQHGADHYVDQSGDLETEIGAALARLKVKLQPAAPVGRLVAVLASSGGSGASTVAVNLAAVLARQHQKCAVLDLKPGRGDQAALLDLKPAFNLADLSLNVGRLDRAMFEKMLVAHTSGIHLLAAPRTFADIRVVTTQGVTQALTLARTYFPFVVVDLEDGFHEEQILALRQASTILLVSRLDFTSLRNARQILEHFGELDIARSSVRLVINRYGQPNELPVAEAEDGLGEKLAHFIPDDPKTINGANNAGIPAVIKAPSTKVAQSFAQLAKTATERRRGETEALVTAVN